MRFELYNFWYTKQLIASKVLVAVDRYSYRTVNKGLDSLAKLFLSYNKAKTIRQSFLNE